MATLKPAAVDVARWFVARTDREAGELITHLKLQKLVYYAQAWHLAYHKRPLFDGSIQAWAHGPVAVPVYQRFKDYKFDAIPHEAGGCHVSKEIEEFLNAIYSAYGIYSAKELERMTHGEDPWRKARGDLPPEAACTKTIAHESMRQYYSARLRLKNVA